MRALIGQSAVGIVTNYAVGYSYCAGKLTEKSRGF